MRVLYRVSRAKHASDLSGEGARLAGGRWNRKGTPVIYTAESRSLAAFEALVHISHPDLLSGRKMVSIGVPETSAPASINPATVPEDWHTYPPPFPLAELGTAWALSMKSLLLRVPSAVVAREFNVLINPRHPDMKHVKIVEIKDFVYDERLR